MSPSIAGAAPRQQPGASLSESADWVAGIETWLFDLDNTLYPPSSAVFSAVTERMNAFIVRTLGVTPEEAARLRRRFLFEHGTTLRGLMIEHGVAPDDYLTDVHAIDLASIAPNPTLDALIERLPGRKIVFTSATVVHAERVLARLGVRRHFEAIFDIVAADYQPKPHDLPYDRLIGRFSVDPARAVMLDDVARNLVPAAQRGMVTVWVPNESAYSRDGHDPAHIHHTAADLTRWLGELFI